MDKQSLLILRGGSGDLLDERNAEPARMMTFDLKPLSEEAVPAALERAMRYRLLNEPGEAESICHDVLRADSENQKALVILLLALTDQFEKPSAVSAMKAQEILPRLRDEYERAYYAGIIYERRAKAQLAHGTPGCGFNAYEGLCEAMKWYEKAEALRTPGNDEALLRWNACARIIMQNKLHPRLEERNELPLE